MNNIENLAVNALRVLSVDAVQKANSGHPGMPLGAAPMAYTVWANHMNFNPADPKWINRDRFVLSAGHGSALLYSLLHVFGYKVSKEDLQNFRQFNSLTPGHPEYGHTDGVEATTGPLGAGLSTAVGMAMAQEHLAAKYNKDGFDVFNNFTYVISGDGCMMEGITSEASSFAGAMNLGRLIVLYDSNNITIEGSTDLSFHEDVCARYEAYGFDTFVVEDGNDIEAINAAITEAKLNLDKPSFIEIRTKIGFGTPKEGSASSHGAPIGEEGIKTFKELVNYPSLEPFYVPEEVYEHFGAIAAEGAKAQDAWNVMMDSYKNAYPELAKQLDQDFTDITVEELTNNKSLFEFENKPMATRNVSGMMINRLKDQYSNIFGGSADLAPSNMTNMNDEDSFSSQNFAGRNIHFGIREHAMAAMGNGIVLYGGLKAYVATFFVFSDFLKPMARLSSLMNLPLTYVLTHDSIGVGEDGPTHEPVEQLTMLRSLPNFYTFRPADAIETAYGWVLALTSKTTPVGLILSRQNLPQLEMSGVDALKGGYVVKDAEKIDAIIMATGSEVSLAIETAKSLEKENIGVRVVSMPCIELFEEQSNEYQESVLPSAVRARVAVEAGSSLSWGKLIGLDGAYVTLDHFGGSAPAPKLFEAFGFTVDNVSETVKSILK
ncbi:transketolase [Erysipelothrix rhusiopathiae]|uniref:Transketolase n=1 Tax=Erysipelothrix rhusiopathiae ATCC 19414 TaxID=525280 RepID=E7FWZ1_ERYRH|nr:transketolase [Erysipelothrix rhusiopathiae]EFY08690.1 transketolase [Erysipelothrix rhusiopathiae ATCC 19414]MDV7680614.1 transketolase [Erysipelothrix rhusiopathiae]VEH83190.1 Transketolase [Erysipelothrix rhusiopathiae]